MIRKSQLHVIDTRAQGLFTRHEPAAPQFAPLSGEAVPRLTFEQVSFHYNPQRPVLNAVDLILEPGDRLAIVGDSGAGKSTLLRLMAGLFSAQHGRILLNNDEVSAQQLASQVWLQSQEDILFNASVLQNITLFDPWYSDSDRGRVEALVEKMALGPVVQALPGGMEALIRWKDGDGEMISPAKFIPIAEKNGTIIPIGNWVLEQSIRTFSEWRNRYGVPFVLSVNISALQYQKEDFVDLLLNIIRKYDVSPEEIELEITESILIDDFQAVTEKMQLLKEYGIRISLDDFGTGFSSLSYLKKLPINTLKIDKSFTDTLLTDSATRIITESIVSMVKSLGFESIAEGVEEEQQYKYLRAIGCDIIQGYLFGKPLSQEEIEQLLQKMY